MPETPDPSADALLPGHLAGLHGDAEMATLVGGRAQLRAWLRVEAALAEAQAEVGDIPGAAAEAIAAAAMRLARELAPQDLAEGTASDGVPVPALVARLRAAVEREGGAEAASFVHFGATSQDVVDSGLMLCLADAIGLMHRRIEGLGRTLVRLADAHRDTVMLARTRTQAATPTSFGLRAAQWLAPFAGHRAALDRLKVEALPLSLGGAAGTQAALGPNARAVEQRMAAALGLALPDTPWHARREGLLEIGARFAAIAGSAAKIAQDILLLGQSELGELRLAGAGGSSTMPNKRNPTAAEAALALARHAGQQLAGLAQALPAQHERDGVAWMQEWLALPALLSASSAALARTGAAIEALEVDADAMRANLDATQGLVLAEAASFALTPHLGRAEAQTLVKRAAADALARGEALTDVLAGMTDAPVDWRELADPARHLGDANAMIDRALARWRG